MQEFYVMTHSKGMYKNKLPILLSISVLFLLFSWVLVIYRANETVTIELRDAETKKSIPGASIGVKPELDVIASPGTCGTGKFLYRPTGLWMPVSMTGTAPGYQKVVVNQVLLPGENYIIWLKKSNSFSQYKPCGIL
ncbi:hypothetical protein I8748_34465 [Nostoc sp. CENA67]|uniref:Uncharacterized protein n=1 Tax=Amazonocrinis nigriterrae CENA67 TaxID=2794033 RepID=A0A8J7LD79_9NOST|nr:hypothetical protein [Amazonocrinis nigriterrae]MBH8567196.1 hypothetical protein [Amazonocrinis nigriterrae CENA67]